MSATRVIRPGDGWVGPESLTDMPLADRLSETNAASGLFYQVVVECCGGFASCAVGLQNAKPRVFIISGSGSV